MESETGSWKQILQGIKCLVLRFAADWKTGLESEIPEMKSFLKERIKEIEIVMDDKVFHPENHWQKKNTGEYCICDQCNYRFFHFWEFPLLSFSMILRVPFERKTFLFSLRLLS